MGTLHYNIYYIWWSLMTLPCRTTSKHRYACVLLRDRAQRVDVRANTKAPPSPAIFDLYLLIVIFYLEMSFIQWVHYTTI